MLVLIGKVVAMFEFHCLENWLLLSAPMSELWYHMYMLPSLHHIHMITMPLHNFTV